MRPTVIPIYLGLAQVLAYGAMIPASGGGWTALNRLQKIRIHTKLSIFA